MGLLTLVRHGQASFGAADYDLLSEVGREQSVAVGEWLAATAPPPDVLITGGLVRQGETARGLLSGANWSMEIDTDPRWDEFDGLGMVAALPDVDDVDLTDRAQFQAAYLRATARWTGGQHDAEYDEPWPAFVRRVGGALEDAAAQAGAGQHVVVVSSGGPIAWALASVLDPGAVNVRVWGSLQETMVNTGISRLLVGRRGLRMSTFNEHSHLETPTYR